GRSRRNRSTRSARRSGRLIGGISISQGRAGQLGVDLGQPAVEWSGYCHDPAVLGNLDKLALRLAADFFPETGRVHVIAALDCVDDDALEAGLPAGGGILDIV